MSTYTLGEIAVWLLIAAVLGMVLGWLLRDMTLGRRRVAPPTQAPVEAASPEPEPGPAVPLEDGGPPTPQHVIKATLRSKIYHVPGSASYDRMTAQVWFVSEHDALEAGFRPPKR